MIGNQGLHSDTPDIRLSCQFDLHTYKSSSWSLEELLANYIDIEAKYLGVPECSSRFHCVSDLYHLTK